jgi:hypothetical protein
MVISLLADPQYFVLVIPFLSILGAIGLYAIGSRVWMPRRPGYLVLVVSGLFALGLVRPAYWVLNDSQPRWQAFEEIAREVNRVTPADGVVWAEGECMECVYFAARRKPPAGFENANSRLLPLSLDVEAVHNIPTPTHYEELLAAGRFATVVIEDNDPRIEAFSLGGLYAGEKSIHGYRIFWDRVSPGR